MCVCVCVIKMLKGLSDENATDDESGEVKSFGNSLCISSLDKPCLGLIIIFYCYT